MTSIKKGLDAYNNEDYDKDLNILSPLAEEGNLEAQNTLGLIYDEGSGVNQDYKEAVKWYRLAAEQGDAYGQFNLGFMYANGYGVIEDNVHALMWWYTASSNRNENAKEYIEEFEEMMTKSKIKEAKRLSKECIKKDYKGCLVLIK
jgi:TPR repeat protein